MTKLLLYFSVAAFVEGCKTATKPSPTERHVTVTAKFWYVSDFKGNAESLADNYTNEMNDALARSNIPVTYIKWGSVQRLPKAQVDIETDGDDQSGDILQNFINTFGDSEDGRQKIKQSADHIVLMVNRLDYAYRCLIFGRTENYATLSVSYDMSGVFLHEAGHCLGAMHDRYTMQEDNSQDYNYGYCLPGSPYSTVMAYQSNCPAPTRERIPHFSNPEVFYKGLPSGDANNNNARAITENRERTSQYGSNCLDGQPDRQGNMVNHCRWTDWTEWSDWTECCCVEYEDHRNCPTEPYTGDDCPYNCVSFLWRKSQRTKERHCLNALNEITSGRICTTEEDTGNKQYEKKRCNCPEMDQPKRKKSGPPTLPQMRVTPPIHSARWTPVCATYKCEY